MLNDARRAVPPLACSAANHDLPGAFAPKPPATPGSPLGLSLLILAACTLGCESATTAASAADTATAAGLDSALPDAGTETEDPDFLTASVPASDLAVPTAATGVERLPQLQLGAGERYVVELAPATDFIDGHPDIDSLVFDGVDTFTVKMKSGKKLPFGKGRVLLSQNEMFARRVLSVSKITSGFKLKTVPARLTETYKLLDIEGDADLYVPPNAAQKLGTVASPLKIVWADVDRTKSRSKTVSMEKRIYDGSKLDVDATGSLTLTTTFHLRLYVCSGGSCGDNVFKTWVKATIDSDAAVSVTATGSASTGEKEVTFGSGWDMPWSFGVVSGLVDFDLVGNFEATVTGQVHTSMRLGFDNLSVKAGASWREGDGWEKVQESTAPTWHTDGSVWGDARVDFTFLPAIESSVLIYGLAGPEVAFGPSCTATVGNPPATGKRCFGIECELTAEVNAVVDLFGILELAEHTFGSWVLASWTVFGECWDL